MQINFFAISYIHVTGTVNVALAWHGMVQTETQEATNRNAIKPEMEKGKEMMMDKFIMKRKSG